MKILFCLCISFLLLSDVVCHLFTENLIKPYEGWQDLKRTTMGWVYQFEGVDYDELPSRLKSLQYDCQGQFIRCNLMSPNMYNACAYNPYSQWYWYVFTACQIDLLNCEQRVEWKYGVYGKERFQFTDNELNIMKDRSKLMYQGECLHGTRRFPKLRKSLPNVTIKDMTEIKPDLFIKIVRKIIVRIRKESIAAVIKARMHKDKSL